MRTVRDVDWQPFGLRGSIYLIGIALTLLVGQALIVLAYRYASAVTVGPFIYTVIVFTALIDWFLWNRARPHCSSCSAWRW